MQPKVIDYQIAQDATPVKVVDMVRRLIKDGWVLHGSLVATHSAERYNPLYAQAMVLYETDGARLVSYAPDGSTCTINLNGQEHYYDRIETEVKS